MLPAPASAVNDTLSTDNCDSLAFVPSLCGTLREYSDKAEWSVEEEKRYLLNVFAEGGIMPRHDFIRQWNGKLAFGNEAPNSAAMDYVPCSDLESVNCIADAWIRTFSLMPSFMENSTFFINGNGEVQMGYYYDLSAPPTVGRDYACSSSRPSDNRYGDCKTVFKYEDLSTYDIKMNGNSVIGGPKQAKEYGENVIAAFPFAGDNPSFSSSILIWNKIWRDHYEWEKRGVCKRVCRTTPKGTKCTTYYHYYCVYKNTDSVDELKSLSHSFGWHVNQFQKQDVSHEIVVGNVKTTPEGTITSNGKDYKVVMGDAVVHKAGSKYPMEYSSEPYNILNLKRVDDVDYFVQDSHIGKTTNSTISFTTYPYNMDECEFVKLWPFNYDTGECSILKKATTNLEIGADKRHYKLDDSIILDISFDSDDGNIAAPVSIRYGDEEMSFSIQGASTVQLKPQEGYRSVYAEFEGDEERSSSEAIPIPVYASNDTFASYIGIAMVFLVVYAMAFFAMRYLPS